VKFVRIAALPIVAMVVVGLAGAPAGAAPVLAAERYKWFYWAGPLLLGASFLFLLALAAGYYIRVLRPKYRGRPVRK
jgi:hypothetical protein